MVKKSFFLYLVALVATLLILFFPYLVVDSELERDPKVVRVMSYSSFIQKWGAGPEIANLFEKETGITIQWINAGNAGLLVERLKFKKDSDQPDIIIGFDQFSIHEARKFFEWVSMTDNHAEGSHTLLPKGAQFFDFMAYDWGPLTFVYKQGAVKPPTKLQDLVDPNYRGQLILQDPRMSSPGLQFLLWVLADMGEEQGFEFLKKLKPSIKVMSPSWSSSYNIFKMQQPSMVFSYFTSPFYHAIEEKDLSYKAVMFENPHPIQVEYAGVPKFCVNCEGAVKLAKFLLTPKAQKILMKKNYMFPVDPKALEGEPFKVPENIKYYKPIENLTLIKKKRELVNLWKKVFY